jgi:hypothetical protein
MTLPLSLLLVSIFGCYEKFSFALWVLVLSSSSPLVFVVGHAGCLVLNDAHGDTRGFPSRKTNHIIKLCPGRLCLLFRQYASRLTGSVHNPAVVVYSGAF